MSKINANGKEGIDNLKQIDNLTCGMFDIVESLHLVMQ